MFKYLKDFVELRTKVASVFPFLYVLVIYLYSFGDYKFNPLLAILFFISMLCLDMATTVLNHLAGFTKEQDISIYDQRLLAQMEELGLSQKFNQTVLIVLVSLGVGLGLIVALLSNLFVVIIGGLCVVVAIAYSYGPVPLKNTCLGEVASGCTMGLLIPLAFLFSQDSSLFITSINVRELTLNLQSIFIWGLILLIPTLAIANIMLANNICDMDKDKDNGRLTLPLIIGKKSSLILWQTLYFLAFILILILILLQELPIIAAFGLLVIPVVFKNGKQFAAKPVKAINFKYAVFNLQIILLTVTIPVIISLLI